ncbi:DUF5777 family beta-barrel protein [Fulvivirga sedimenti]|uniref:DUF5777 family beta-barrel protein n=1 Tax=Fulvivirga sedimenti TaxID=2879465 RepID=A0A9X1HT77_9BACT|nr:DUF5777 family beta-barrel protein [Fulvivirga sedimenti]MCA6074550.1 DUF5777 family beta-barrel protein [Fulvivirga sedimenti]MCA6075727.1 DUF5777 family beta-barrel protein [Fulvivirga sedimenti]MCA6076855.1 DUF5777 family beta-barrel protein [Fulvivirga sedimenti]
MLRTFFSFVSLMIIALPGLAQNDLLESLESEQVEATQIIESTFKGTRLINGHSVETRGAGTLEFIISHRFGELSSGGYNLFGLDNSNIRFGLEYGISDKLYIGIGRSSFEKTFDGFLKYRVIRQKSVGSPVSVTLFTSGTVKTLRQPEKDLSFKDKLAYTTQLLIAHKFSESVSLQLMPSYIHFNLIGENDLRNDILAIGAGGRVKLSKRISLNLEYYYQVEPLNDDSYNSLAIGIDIETGGHVFQIQLTNSRSMIEKGFIAETMNDFFAGDIHLGFNITRAFQLKKQ